MNKEITTGKRMRKLTKKGLRYQISLLNAKLIRKSTENEDLLFSMRDKITVEEWINQFNKVVDLFVAADKEYKKRKQVNERDDEWFKNFDY